tara:strand:- start:794 stop:943 length:150 start_codon:yes stop_codon:yes gene_type:complete
MHAQASSRRVGQQHVFKKAKLMSMRTSRNGGKQLIVFENYIETDQQRHV